MPFAAAISEHPVTATAVGETAGQILDSLGPAPDVALLFVTAHHAGALEDAVGAVATILEPAALAGCAAESVLGDGREIDDRAGIALWAARGTPAEVMHLESDGDGVRGWVPCGADPALVVVMSDPHSFAEEPFFAWLHDHHPATPVVGGHASAARGPGGNRLAVRRRIHSTGAVAVLLGGSPVETVVAQGCRPIGSPYVVTRAERNVVYEIGGRAAYERLVDIAGDLDEEDQRLLGAGLVLGVVVDERRADYGPGAFVMRNVLGADKAVGAIALDADVPVGAAVQYHLRHAATADDDLGMLLRGRSAGGALLITDQERGRRTFADRDHDARAVSDALAPIAVAGFAAAGTFGPIGRRNFAHRASAAMALLHDPRP